LTSIFIYQILLVFCADFFDLIALIFLILCPLNPLLHSQTFPLPPARFQAMRSKDNDSVLNQIQCPKNKKSDIKIKKEIKI